MKKERLFILAFILIAAWGCNKEEEVTTGTVRGLVSDAINAANLDNVKIIVFESNSNEPVQSVSTGADGTYEAELLPGSYYLRLYRQGYEHIPPRNISPIPFSIILGEELDKPVEMNPSSLENTGFLSGKVQEGGKGIAGALVVGEKDGKGYSTVSDSQGNYNLYNLPAGSYTVKAWIGGFNSEQKSVNISRDAESNQDILLQRGVSGSVTGSISFLASTAVEVDVALTHPLTHEAIPGLNTLTNGSYTIENVAAGRYLARATYRNDERVVDPDWIVKFGEPYVELSTEQATRNFSLTGSLKIMNPTNLANTTVPKEVSTSTPVFSWYAYSSASDYVIEVSDASGNVIWGGFDYSQDPAVKKVVIPSNRTSVEFNEDGSATSNLLPGSVYRWKVYVSKNDNQSASGWRLISVSEDQLGLIKIAK